MNKYRRTSDRLVKKGLGGLIGTAVGAGAGTFVGNPMLGASVGGAIGGGIDSMRNKPNKITQPKTTGTGHMGYKYGGNIKQSLPKYPKGGQMREIGPNAAAYSGPSHEAGGIPIDAQGNPNQSNPVAEVEGGETRQNDFIFSDELMVPGTEMSFAEAHEMLLQEGAEEADIEELAMMQEQVKQEQGISNDGSQQQMAMEGQEELPMMDSGGRMPSRQGTHTIKNAHHNNARLRTLPSQNRLSIPPNARTIPGGNRMSMTNDRIRSQQAYGRNVNNFNRAVSDMPDAPYLNRKIAHGSPVNGSANSSSLRALGRIAPALSGGMDYMRRREDGQSVENSIGGAGVTAGGAWAGAKAGAAVGALSANPFGVVAGGISGGIIGSVLAAYGADRIISQQEAREIIENSENPEADFEERGVPAQAADDIIKGLNRPQTDEGGNYFQPNFNGKQPGEYVRPIEPSTRQEEQDSQQSDPTEESDANLSLVDTMDQMGIDSSFEMRKKIAWNFGLTNYTGTAEENRMLLEYITSDVPMPSQPNTSNIERQRVPSGVTGSNRSRNFNDDFQRQQQAPFAEAMPRYMKYGGRLKKKVDKYEAGGLMQTAQRYAPSVIDAGMALFSKKPEKVTPNKITPTTIDKDRSNYNDAKSNIGRSARTAISGGANPQATHATTLRGLSSAAASQNEYESSVDAQNAGIINNAQSQNAQMQYQADVRNNENRMRDKASRMNLMRNAVTRPLDMAVADERNNQQTYMNMATAFAQMDQSNIQLFKPMLQEMGLSEEQINQLMGKSEEEIMQTLQNIPQLPTSNNQKLRNLPRSDIQFGGGNRTTI